MFRISSSDLLVTTKPYTATTYKIEISNRRRCALCSTLMMSTLIHVINYGDGRLYWCWSVGANLLQQRQNVAQLFQPNQTPEVRRDRRSAPSMEHNNERLAHRECHLNEICH